MRTRYKLGVLHYSCSRAAAPYQTGRQGRHLVLISMQNTSGFYAGDTYDSSVDNMMYNYNPRHPVMPPSRAADNSQALAYKLDQVLDELKKQREEGAELKKELQLVKTEVSGIKEKVSSATLLETRGARRIPTDLRVNST